MNANLTFTALLFFRFLLLRAIETTAEQRSFFFQYYFSISVPDAAGHDLKTDKYVCTVQKLNFTEGAVYLEKFLYTFSETGNAHHFLLYGCKSVSSYALKRSYWPCNARGFGNVCSDRKHIPMGISQDNPGKSFKPAMATFPTDVAYGIGRNFDINYIMLEIHFVPAGEKSNDTNQNIKRLSANVSGISFQGTNIRPKYLAGMMVLTAAGFQIPPGRKKFSVDINCQPKLSTGIVPYAIWVHTHDLGTVVSGYKVAKKSKKFTELARWTYKWKQPVIIDQKRSESLSIFPGDYVAGKCTYNSSNRTSVTKWGPRKRYDEMCNLFMFYFTSSINPQDLSISCVNAFSKEISSLFPPEADTLPVIISEMNATSAICGLYKFLKIVKCPFE